VIFEDTDAGVMAAIEAGFDVIVVGACELVPMRIRRFRLERADEDEIQWLQETILPIEN